jgi:hypothetical protein
MFNIMENNLLFTKKNDNDRITMIYCEKNQKGGRSGHRWQVYGRWYSDSFNPRKSGSYRRMYVIWTGKSRKRADK